MVRNVEKDSKQRLEEFRQRLELARTLQDDIIKYGLAAADLYCDDVDSDWLESWAKEETDNIIESIVNFLSSDDSIAVCVKEILPHKSLESIATELSRCLNFSQDEARIFAVKSLFADNLINGDVCSDRFDLMSFARELVEKLEGVRS